VARKAVIRDAEARLPKEALAGGEADDGMEAVADGSGRRQDDLVETRCRHRGFANEQS